MVWLLCATIVAGVLRDLTLILSVVLVTTAHAWFSGARTRGLWVGLAVLCATIGWTRAARLDADRAHVARIASQHGAAAVTMRGCIVDFPRTNPHGTSFTFRTRLHGRTVRLLVRAACFDVSYGDSLEVRARLDGERAGREAYLRSRDLAGSARVRFRDVRPLADGGGCPLVRAGLWPMHREARTRLSRALGADAPLALGLVLGERGQMARADYDAVRRLGIVHLLAISGMHLTTVAAMAVLVARGAPRYRNRLVLGALAVYVATVGHVESLTRAILMAFLLILAERLARPARPMDTLARALFLMLIVSPTAILSIGFQLSFAATAAVIHVLARTQAPAAPSGGWFRRVLRSLARGAGLALVMSAAVEVAIAPLQLWHFGVISVVGPLATALFVLPVSLVLAASLAAIPLSTLPALGEWLAAAVAFGSRVTLDMVTAAGGVAPDPVALPVPHLVLYYMGVACLAARGGRRWRVGVGTALIVLSFAVA